jgi:hypothetical protein
MQSSSIPITSHNSILLSLGLSLSGHSTIVPVVQYIPVLSPVHQATLPSAFLGLPLEFPSLQPPASHNPKISSHQTIHSLLFPQGKPIFTTTLLSTASTSFSDQIDHPNPPFLFSPSVQIPALLASSRCSSSHPIYSALFGPKLSAVCSAKPNLYRPILLKIRRARLRFCPENASLMFFVPWNPIFAVLF